MEENFTRIALIFAFIHAASHLYSSGIVVEDIEYFETHIRPVLIENCYKCHSADADKIKGGFLLDSKPAMLRGGDSGPAIIPGDVEGSRLIQMIRQHPEFESMPPKTKLSQDQISDIESWVGMGAPDPRLEETRKDAIVSEFNLEERKQWWSLQPVKKFRPPNVKDKQWPTNDYDPFILAKLEEKDWSPAEPANKWNLLRRLSFDLIGLAPTTEELNSFVNDQSRNAYKKQVDRLLASPHFGEKWARHWMDLTRYAESKSFEQDYTMAFAWRYRDYLINAFNQDVPYDQFVLESLAGDLLKNPRIDPVTDDNESAKGPGFLYLTDGQHGPPDLHEDEARIFDGMIDTVSKAFLGTTVACARCHDHKFDAVTTADYYSMYGLLSSSRFTYHNTVSEKLQIKVRSKLASKKKSIRLLAFDAAKPDVDNSLQYLELSKEIVESDAFKALLASLESGYPSKERKKNNGQYTAAYDKALIHICEKAASGHIRPTTLSNWVKLLSISKIQNNWPELSAIHQKERKIIKDEETSATFAKITKSLEDWKTQGLSFEDQPSKHGTLVLSGDGNQVIQNIIGDTPLGGQYAARISGAIRSPDFIIDGKPIRLQAKGKFGAIRLVIRNYELTGRGPTTAILYHAIDGNHWQDIEMETYLWPGQPAYLEVYQNGAATHSLKPKEDELSHDDNAYITFRFEEGKMGFGEQSAESLLAQLPNLWEKGRRNHLNPEEADLLSAFFGAGLIEANLGVNGKLNHAMLAYRELAQQIPPPRLTRGLADGDPKDQPVYIRGLHTNPSREPNHRRWLDGLGGQPLKTKGSGRLEWANQVVDSDNPLTARVMMNRMWKQLFGSGLVATVNDFGHMGRNPTHPELLDYLARDFMRNDWSIKTMLRKLVSTSTYRMSSTPNESSISEDPANLLLQHMPVKRLEAEAIRDHILACSGELNTTLFGPSAEAYVADHPDSRAKPTEGPLDGNGRRSVYMEIRRSFLPSFLRVFDLPNATEPIGARPLTNVPAQSLALMNDPFVHQQAAAWADKLTRSKLSTTERIQDLHLTAYSRPPNEREMNWAKDFIQTMAQEYRTDEDDPKVWTDLCHLMYNRKDFIYLF